MEFDQFVLGAIYASKNSKNIVQVVEITQEYGDYAISTNMLRCYKGHVRKIYSWKKDFDINIHVFREATKEEEQIYYEAQLWRTYHDRDYLDIEETDTLLDVDTLKFEMVDNINEINEIGKVDFSRLGRPIE